MESPHLLVAVGNAAAVVEGLGGAEGPAASAGALVADVADQILAAVEVGGGIERIGGGGEAVGVALTLAELKVVGVGVRGEDSAEEVLDVSDGGVDEPKT